MAMFRSTEAAQFAFLWPMQLVTPITPGDPLAVNKDATLANLSMRIKDGVGTTVATVALDTLPAGGISLVGSTSGVQIFCDPSVLATKAGGGWFAVLTDNADSTFAPQEASCQWGGTVDLLCNAAAVTIPGGLLYDTAVGQLSDPGDPGTVAGRLETVYGRLGTPAGGHTVASDAGLANTYAQQASNKADTLLSIGQNGFVFDEGGTSGKLTLYMPDDVTAICHWICYSDKIRVTKAVHWAQVVSRGALVMGA